MDEQSQDNQLEPTYSSCVLIWDVALRTSRKQWTIGRGGEKGSGSGISMLLARHDDDDIYEREFVFSFAFFFLMFKSSLTQIVLGHICDSYANNKQLQYPVSLQNTDYSENDKSKHSTMKVPENTIGCPHQLMPP